MASQADPNLGQLLLNRYRLAKLVGQGSMGKVYLAEDQTLDGVPVAAKFLSQALLSEKMKTRFAQEARTGAKLGHRSNHIVRVIDYGVNHADVPFYIMEYMESGGSLSDLIATKPLVLDRFLNLMRQVCLGLQAAHAGIKLDGQLYQVAHRDIKPSNVFIIPDPALGELAKVLDFGIAQFLSDGIEGTQNRSFMGTLAYASPEQIEGQDIDGRSDIYSLGITMFEVLTGRMPVEPATNSIGSWYKAHRSQSPRKFSEVAPHLQLPETLVDLIMGCLEKGPANRPQNMAEILDVLQLLDHPTPVDPSPVHEPRVEPPLPDQQAPEPVIESETKAKSAQGPETPNPQQLVWSIEGAGWDVQWPADKPIADIVFPSVLESEHQEAIGLWMMLSRNEIQQRLLNARYNQFLCTMQPHPMILWITTLYDRSLGARWLPCYLDLKHARGRKIANLLSQTGYYPVLFFAREDPEQPANVRTFSIAPDQRVRFQEWLQQSKHALSVDSSMTSKRLLKAELEKNKPKILRKLQLSQGQSIASLFS
ncbi:MAG: serine/threonine-protein kinase [Cyanobacteria bacterium P01_A01_bin.17]